MLNNRNENKEIQGKEGTGICDKASLAPKAVQSAQISGLKHVENSATYREGQCTEACVAMWANRFNGTNLTANDVYEDMEVFGKQQSPTIAPDKVPANRMLQEYYHCGPCERYKGVSPNNVLFQLRAGKPVIMYLKNTTSGRVHAVIVKGIQINGSIITYTVDDPNKKHDPSSLKERTITQYVSNADTASERISTYTTYSEPSKNVTFDSWYATIANSIW